MSRFRSVFLFLLLPLFLFLTACQETPRSPEEKERPNEPPPQRQKAKPIRVFDAVGGIAQYPHHDKFGTILALLGDRDLLVLNTEADLVLHKYSNFAGFGVRKIAYCWDQRFSSGLLVAMGAGRGEVKYFEIDPLYNELSLKLIAGPGTFDNTQEVWGAEFTTGITGGDDNSSDIFLWLLGSNSTSQRFKVFSGRIERDNFETGIAEAEGPLYALAQNSRYTFFFGDKETRWIERMNGEYFRSDSTSHQSRRTEDAIILKGFEHEKLIVHEFNGFAVSVPPEAQKRFHTDYQLRCMAIDLLVPRVYFGRPVANSIISYDETSGRTVETPLEISDLISIIPTWDGQNLVVFDGQGKANVFMLYDFLPKADMGMNTGFGLPTQW